MFDLDSWLTGFALGLAGKPLPFSTAKETLLYNLSNFSGRYLSSQYRSNNDQVYDWVSFGVGEAPLEFSANFIDANSNPGAGSRPRSRADFVLQQAITAGSNVRIKVLFPEYTIDSTYHDSNIVDKPVYKSIEKTVRFLNGTGIAQQTAVYIKNEELGSIGFNGNVIDIADDAMTLLRNNAGEIIGVDVYGTLALDMYYIDVSCSYAIEPYTPNVDAVVRTAFNSYNDIQIWLD